MQVLLNKIKTTLVKDDTDKLYYAVDAIMKYDVNYLIGETGWFDPYVYLTGGIVSVESTGDTMLNVGLGFNTWFSDNIGLNFQHNNKLGFAQNVRSHYQKFYRFSC